MPSLGNKIVNVQLGEYTFLLVEIPTVQLKKVPGYRPGAQTIPEVMKQQGQPDDGLDWRLTVS